MKECVATRAREQYLTTRLERLMRLLKIIPKHQGRSWSRLMVHAKMNNVEAKCVVLCLARAGFIVTDPALVADNGGQVRFRVLGVSASGVEWMRRVETVYHEAGLEMKWQ